MHAAPSAGTLQRTMQNTHRITIEAFLIPTINRAGAENDPACAAFVFGVLRFAWRYAGALRIGNLAIVRKGLVMEVSGEPPADFLAELQRLGDEFEVATTAKGQAPGDFEPRVKVERLAESVAGEMTSVAIDQPGSEVERQVAGGRLRITFEPENATATAKLLPGDDIANPTPMFARDEATGEWVESDRDPVVV